MKDPHSTGEKMGKLLAWVVMLCLSWIIAIGLCLMTYKVLDWMVRQF